MEKTDRYLIAGALLLLSLTIGAYYSFDRLFGSAGRVRSGVIASIVQGQGDMRVKFKDDFHWQRARLQQDLVFDDSIFSGEKSHVDLKIGNSDLSLDSNTLVVLRKEDLMSTLNLNYGGLQGLIAAGDHILLDTGGGERVELSSKDNTRLSVVKTGERMTIRVKSGVARVKSHGKVQTVTPETPMLVELAKPKADPIELLSPQRTYFYSRESKRTVPFRWNYSSHHQISGSDAFFVEFSQTLSFTDLALKETVLGEDHLDLALAVPSKLFMRVRDAQGNSSPVRQILLNMPSPPQIVSPANMSELDAPIKLPLRLMIGLSQVPATARVAVQLAHDAEFKNLVLDKMSSVPELVVELQPGKYFARARSAFDADNLQSEWSPLTQFSVRESLDLPRMVRQGMPYRVVIPNAHYPKKMFGARDENVQDFVRQISPLPEFFAAFLAKGYDLMIGLSGRPESERQQLSAAFPTDWIYPGKVDIAYRLEAGGATKYNNTHRVMIELEPPRIIRSTSAGQLSWTPLLFARSYEGELRDPSGKQRLFKSRRPAMVVPQLAAGQRYSFRVRAIGRGGQPISDWSSTQDFATPAPPAPIQLETAPPLAAAEPAPVTRLPAQANSNAIRVKEEPSTFLHRMGAWLWGGSGYNFVLVRQTIASTADVEYKNSSGPSAYVEAGFLDLGGVGAMISYKRTPGQVRIDNYPVNEKDFVWDTSSAEGLYRLAWQPQILSRIMTWVLRAGFQYQQFPFLYVAPDRSLIKGQNNMTTASLGFMTETAGRLKYHWSMRYQQPVHTSSEGGNSFSVSPKLAFDGSVGASYLLNDNWKMGTFWYGQYHNYAFNYFGAGQTNVGNQSLFFSTMELRLGYDF